MLESNVILTLFCTHAVRAYMHGYIHYNCFHSLRYMIIGCWKTLNGM